MNVDVAVVGGGIAGLSTAWALQCAGVGRVAVLERDALPGQRATGHNAGIYRQLEGGDAAGTDAARVAGALMGGLASEAPGPLLSRRGVLYLSAQASLLNGLCADANASGVGVLRYAPDEVQRTMPILCGSAADRADFGALVVPSDGTLDVDGLVQALVRELRRRNGVLLTAFDVWSVRAEGTQAARVLARDGREVLAGHVVLAAGAWSAGVMTGLGLPLPGVVSLRRHLAWVLPEGADAAGNAPAPGWGAAWRLDAQAYARWLAPGWLMSPADEDAVEPDHVPVADDVAERMYAAAQRLRSSLTQGRLVRAWACTRTVADDRRFVVGPDPRWPRLLWCTALGGRGMSCALGVGQTLANHLVHGAAIPPAWLPGRLL